jgi:2-(1,2-epoxy-1,2-dihydrophenyl)acetyl-CoA isomerase
MNVRRIPRVRCIYITGAGKGFCAGQDLAEVVDPNGPGMAKILVNIITPSSPRLRNIPKPIVAAVNGVAAGAGANIALACDIVVSNTICLIHTGIFKNRFDTG